MTGESQYRRFYIRAAKACITGQFKYKGVLHKSCQGRLGRYAGGQLARRLVPGHIPPRAWLVGCVDFIVGEFCA